MKYIPMKVQQSKNIVIVVLTPKPPPKLKTINDMICTQT